MARPGWYMFCYDIADPKRLGKVHRIMKKNGMAAQRSLFFVHGTEEKMEGLLKELEQVIHPRKDDIRAYPVEAPDKVWTTGGVLESFPLVVPGARKKTTRNKKAKGPVSFWNRIWKRIKT